MEEENKVCNDVSIESGNADNMACVSEDNIESALKAKYPTAAFSGHSAFLQKKLAKGQKYFDSGDYQMARQSTAGICKGRQSQTASNFFNFPTGEAIPTPESVPVRKTSIIQPKFHSTIPSTVNSSVAVSGQAQICVPHGISSKQATSNVSESSQ